MTSITTTTANPGSVLPIDAQAASRMADRAYARAARIATLQARWDVADAAAQQALQDLQDAAQALETAAEKLTAAARVI
jgi:hypothetical protein